MFNRASRTPTLVVALLALCLGGCTQWRHNLGERLGSPHEQPPARGTSLAEVLAALGPPLRMSSTEAGYVMAWESWRIHEDSVGLSLGALGADFLSVDWGDARIAGEFTLVVFDRQHQVAASAYSRWDNDGGGGSAVQPFVGLAQVVDIDDLLDSLPQHHWGADLFGELPVVLNRGARPGLGNNGLQQRGTPSGVGQRTLEMD